jgi:hypothetical protein
MRIFCQASESEQQPSQWSNSDAIHIIPVDLGQYEQPHIAIPDQSSYSTSQEIAAIVINTSANFDPQEEARTDLPVMQNYSLPDVVNPDTLSMHPSHQDVSNKQSLEPGAKDKMQSIN